MQRITEKFLREQISYLNHVSGYSGEIYTYDDHGRVSGGIPGTYTLSGAYGGWALHAMASGGGTGVRDVFGSGHMPARELSGRISAYLQGVTKV